MVKKPLLVITLVKVILISFLSGCTTIEVAAPLPCPITPELTPITGEMQLEMDPATVQIVADNQLKLKRYAAKLRSRAGCE